MEKSRLPELYCVSPALALIFHEMKEVVDRHKHLTAEFRIKANQWLREVADNISLSASDSAEDHEKGDCHCLKAIDLMEKLAEQLRAVEKVAAKKEEQN